MEGTSRYHRFAFACALLLAALGAACAEKAVAPDRESITPPPGTENVYIVSEGDVILNGRLFGAEHEAVVILSHMRPNDQSAWFPFAEELADNGYAALTFNFRGYGESEGDQDFNKLDEDLSAAVRYMRDRGKREIFLVGASMGATTSLVTAAEQRDISGVVAISAPSKFEEQDALGAVSNVTAPKLFIASEDDTAALLSLEELLDAAGQPKESEVYTGNAHGTNFFQGEHAAAVRERILRFLQEHGGP